MDLREYLEEHHKITDYIPPYGTQLTVRDFSPWSSTPVSTDSP